MPLKQIPDFQFWHSRHVCGDAIYWSCPNLAIVSRGWPCPWCPSRQRVAVSPETLIVHDVERTWFAFRTLLPCGGVPWPWPETGRVLLRHRADGSCCIPAPAPVPRMQLAQLAPLAAL